MSRTHYLFGNKIESEELNIAVALEYFSQEKLNDLSKRFMQIPLENILNVLEKTGLYMYDKEKPYYKQCMESLPHMLHYAPKMVEKGLSFIPSLLSRKTMLDRLSHLGNHHALDYPVYSGKGQLKRAVPTGIVCHLAAGNTFLGAIDSLLYGVITKNINIVKMSANDCFFPIVFMEALREADTDNIIFPYITMTYWKSSNESIAELVKNTADIILLFGGEEAVKSVKKEIAPKCEVIAFGPKTSFGIVSAELSQDELSLAAKGFATDIVFWEQRACTACQNIFIEKSENTDYFLQALFSALEETGITFPQETVNTDAAVEIRKQREIALWEQFTGNGQVMEGTTSNHSILVKYSNYISDSPLERTVIVNIVNAWKDILNASVPALKYYMSTVSIASKHKQEIMNTLIPFGVMRFCSPGLMSSSASASYSHDGKYIVESLIRFINFEDFNDAHIGLDFMSEKEKEPILLSRINTVLSQAIQTPFYKQKYTGIDLPLKNFQEFQQLNPLTKEEMASISAHHSDAAFTAADNHCYLFSAGGSTGLKKYVLYSADEFSKSKELFGKGFRALGIKKQNVVANLFPCGALYTAFLAINKGLEETECKIISLTGNISHKDTLEYFTMCKPDTIFGLPSLLIPLAQYAEQNNYRFQLENIIYAAEHMTADAKKYLQAVFHAKKISSFGYAAVETGPIGYQCNCCKDNEFHVEEEWAYLESDENNEALVSCLHKSLQPIIRYKVGDCIEFIHETCKCGRLSPKFRLLGRSGEKIRISGYSEIYFEEIEKTTQSIVKDGFVIQLLLDPYGLYTQLRLNVETGSWKDTLLKEKLYHGFLNKIPVLQLPKEKNMISQFEVFLLEPYTLPRVERSGKVRRIIDNRI
ncbi:MAG: hypothetical protein KBA86_03710 [Bacteroidales bacterium]|nr:hypothetical protein [Bacteroidales bacterium]